MANADQVAKKGRSTTRRVVTPAVSSVCGFRTATPGLELRIWLDMINALLVPEFSPEFLFPLLTSHLQSFCVFRVVRVDYYLLIGAPLSEQLPTVAVEAFNGLKCLRRI